MTNDVACDDFVLLDERSTANFLQMSPRSLQQWRQNGSGPKFIKLSPKAVRYRKSDLIIWINSRTRTSTAQGGAA